MHTLISMLHPRTCLKLCLICAILIRFQCRTRYASLFLWYASSPYPSTSTPSHLRRGPVQFNASFRAHAKTLPTSKPVACHRRTNPIPIWLQMLADFTGMRLEIPQIEETGCLGAALMAMQGKWISRCLSSTIYAACGTESGLFCSYQAKYQRYQQLTTALKAML